MELNVTKVNCITALTCTAMMHMTDTTMTEVKENSRLLEVFKLTASVLGIGHEVLEFFIDLISQSPYRIFKCLTPNPKINLEMVEILAEFDSSRLEMLADVTKYPRKGLRQVIAVWINSYNLISDNKHIFETLGNFNLKQSSKIYFELILNLFKYLLIAFECFISAFC